MPDPLIRSYSPSETEIFLRCPMLWWVGKKQGWRPRVEPEWTPNRLIGSAVQAGLVEVYKVWGGTPLRSLPPEATSAAHAMVEAEYVDQDTWTVETLKGLVSRGLDIALKGPQLEGMASVVLNEQDVYGRRPDVVFRTTEGALVVDDNKVVLSLDAHKEPWRLAEYNHSWQLKDYAHHVGEFLCEPVMLTRIHLIVLGPRKHTTLHPIPQSKAGLTYWYKSAKETWATMQGVEEGGTPWQNLQACTNRGLHFGQVRCPMYDWCHVYHGDPTLAQTLYEHDPERGKP